MAEEATEQVIDTEQVDEHQPDSTTGTDELTDEQKQAAEEEAERQAAEKAESERQEQEEVEKKPWFKKRFDEITRQKYQEKERADAAERRALEFEQRLQKLEDTPKKPEFKPTSPKPEWESFLDKYDDPDEAHIAYTDALTDWKLEQRDAKAKADRDYQTQQDRQAKAQQTFDQKRQATVAAGVEKFSDWEDVVFAIPGAIMHQNLATAIMEIPTGDEVAYYLGKNLAEAEKISQLSPYAMAAELGKIEAKLASYEKKTTKPPPSSKPLKGNAPATNEIDPGKDPKGWIKERERKLREKE
jgi:hypothetical protein